ncbi:MAG TPA: hypothetical protein VEH62_06595 [Gemmatimonadales bacterium]|nr:hypothetical protein [Gemmatimonadales bacterium]
MPLFTNPRYATGFRVHADLGLPTSKTTSLGDYNVIQGGVTFALGPVGIGANVGSTRNDFKTITSGGSSANVGASTKVTASALLQLRVYGGGQSPWALSLFGGASMDINGFTFANIGSLPTAIQDSIKSANPKILTIPVGAALGLKLPLVIVNPNVWVAPRFNLTRITNCPTGATCSTDSQFRWAVGVDVPIFRVISVRAAFDSGKIKGATGTQTVNAFGFGASIGIGGMR